MGKLDKIWQCPGEMQAEAVFFAHAWQKKATSANDHGGCRAQRSREAQGSDAFTVFQIQVNKDKSNKRNLERIYKYLKELLGAIKYTRSFILG